MTDQALSQLCDQVRELLPRTLPVQGIDHGEKGSYEIWGRAPSGTGVILCSRSEWEHRAEESKATGELFALAPTMAAALLKLREERDALVIEAVKQGKATGIEAERAEQAEAKLAEIAMLVNEVQTMEGISVALALKAIAAIATSGKGQ